MAVAETERRRSYSNFGMLGVLIFLDSRDLLGATSFLKG